MPTEEPAPRRSGVFRHVEATSLEAIAGELDRLLAAWRDGRLVANGAWTPGQVARHLAIFIGQSIDGFTFRPPAPVRAAGRVMRRWALGPKPMPKGIRFRGGMTVLDPAPVSTPDGFAELRRQLDRVLVHGERFTRPSPLFGPLTHDEWVRMHVKHAVHHLGFLDVEREDH